MTTANKAAAVAWRQAIYRGLCYALNVGLFASILMTLYAAIWEYSTRRYLKGFVDAVVPASASPEQKVGFILNWISHGSARGTALTTEDPAGRDPEVSLNYEGLLEVCGTATNAYVNLAKSSGLEARRLLLLDEKGETTHVVAEIYLSGRWIVVDPAFHAILRDANGRMLTRQELADPKNFQEATRNLSRYDPKYNYRRTSHVHLRSIPLIGKLIRRTLAWAYPSWDQNLDLTLLTERESYGALATGIALLVLGLSLVRLLNWYAEKHAGLNRFRLIDQLRQGGVALLGN